MGMGLDRATSWCLTHQRPETDTALLGRVCAGCKQRLYLKPPRGECRSFWESQPAAYTLDGRPCFVYRLAWDDFVIRTLHAPETEEDHRSANIPREPALRDEET
jgi:hypothetical protein